MKQTILNRHQQTLSVLINDKNNKKGLVFVAHGLGGFKEQDQIKYLTQAFLKACQVVVSWDMANTLGESSGSIEKATLTNYFEDFEDVIKWTKKQSWYKEPFIVTGHSLGSACCILYTSKYPTEVYALAPISVFISTKTFLKSIPKKELELWQKHGYMEQKSNSKPGATKKLSWSLVEDLKKYELMDKARLINKPTLLVVGSEDTSTPLSDQKIFYEL